VILSGHSHCVIESDLKNEFAALYCAATICTADISSVEIIMMIYHKLHGHFWTTSATIRRYIYSIFAHLELNFHPSCLRNLFVVRVCGSVWWKLQVI
jgi:hypothetical protein